MRNLQISIPDELLVTLNQSEDEFISAMKMDYAARLFQDEKLSLGQAAALAGKTYPYFLEYLHERHIPVLRYTPGELDRELKALESLRSI